MTIIKIDNIINTPINENYNFDDIDINVLTNNLLEQIQNIKEPNINIIHIEELQIFFNILISIIKDDENIIEFILSHIIAKFKKNNKFLYKFDTDNLIDKYLTKQIKSYDIKLYHKYCGNDKLINHISILYLLDTYFLEDKFEDKILIPAFSLFKHQITNPKILNRVFEIVK